MGKKILLIDDNQDMHLLIGYILKKSGFKMKSAFIGEEGLQYISSYKPDLVILDYMMPKKNGPEVFREFISEPKYKKYHHIPFIMLTARHTDERDMDKMLELGIAVFLNKPFGQKELINVIQNIMTTQKIQMKKDNLYRAISDAKDFLTNLVENIPSALFIVDANGEITYYNGGLQHVLKYTEDMLINRPFKKIVDLSDEKNRESLKLLKRGEEVAHLEMNLLSSDGRRVPFNLSVTPMTYKKGVKHGSIIIGNDISEIKRLEAVLIEKEKLATLAETAVALNHEINNPLSPILGNIQLLLAKSGDFDPQTKKKLESIRRNAERIHEIMKKLRSIKKPVQSEYLGDVKMLDIQKSN